MNLFFRVFGSSIFLLLAENIVEQNWPKKLNPRILHFGESGDLKFQKSTNNIRMSSVLINKIQTVEYVCMTMENHVFPHRVEQNWSRWSKVQRHAILKEEATSASCVKQSTQQHGHPRKYKLKGSACEQPALAFLPPAQVVLFQESLKDEQPVR